MIGPGLHALQYGRSSVSEPSHDFLAGRLLDGAQNVANQASSRGDEQMYILGHDDVGPDKESVAFARKAKAVEEDVANLRIIEKALTAVAGEGEFMDMAVDVKRLAFEPAFFFLV